MSPAPEPLSRVTLARIDETFYQAAAAVVARVLRSTGLDVAVVDGSHTQAYGMVGSGEADLCVAFWLPSGHAEAWAALDGRVEALASIFDDARFFWAIPGYVDRCVADIADLADPEVAAMFPKNIRGLSLDATITTASQEALRRYGLSDVGFTVTPGVRRLGGLTPRGPRYLLTRRPAPVAPLLAEQEVRPASARRPPRGPPRSKHGNACRPHRHQGATAGTDACRLGPHVPIGRRCDGHGLCDPYRTHLAGPGGRALDL